MIGILGFLHDHPEISSSKMEARGQFITKYFNRLGAVKLLTSLDREFFRNECERMHDTLLNLTDRKAGQDDTLYNF